MNQREALLQLTRDMRRYLLHQRSMGVRGVTPAPEAERAVWEERQHKIHKARVERAAAALRGGAPTQKRAPQSGRSGGSVIGSAMAAAPPQAPPVGQQRPTQPAAAPATPQPTPPANTPTGASAGAGHELNLHSGAPEQAPAAAPPGFDVWKRTGARPRPMFVAPVTPAKPGQPTPDAPRSARRQERDQQQGRAPQRRGQDRDSRGGSGQGRDNQRNSQGRGQTARRSQQGNGLAFTAEDLPPARAERAPTQVGLLAQASVPVGPGSAKAMEGLDATPEERAALREMSAFERMVQLRRCLGDCQRCGLAQKRNRIVFGDGAADARIMFIGEAPGYNEDKQGVPFVGKAGHLLDRMIQAMGMQRQDIFIANVLKCRPPNNRDPAPEEIRQCSPFLYKQIELVQPDVILTFGRFASQCLLDTRKPMRALRGQWHYWRDVPVMPTFHPAFLLRSPDRKRDAWADLQKVMFYLEHLDTRR